MLTALTPVLNTVLHRFTSLALLSAVLQLPPSLALLSTLAFYCAAHWLTMTQLTVSCCPLALYAVYSQSWTFITALGSLCRILYLILIRECSGIPAAFEIRSFLGHHTTRRCCPLLQYVTEIHHITFNIVWSLSISQGFFFHLHNCFILQFS